ncbi:hypothetical protein SpCBS45565_g05526 [Spizellomyces sp. 'palustris']|nr:hypothetical protein SpCBS45565_g05526 [Spizellomyces sp. 'palustris']
MTVKEEISLRTVAAAAERIQGHAHKTVVLTSATLSSLFGRDPSTDATRTLLFKCENFQRVGAFKFRGAFNAVSRLCQETPELAAKGIVTHSSGNHGQAVALAAKLNGVPAYVVMPSTAPQVKKDAVKGYGATVVECVPTLQAREDTAAKVINETGATFIHPYNHPDVISGQGTLALEFLKQAEELGHPLDALIAPVGGGGMLSGCITAAKAINPNIRIFAAEPLGANDCAQSFQSKTFIPSVAPKSIADGLLTSLGSLTWPIIRDNVEDVRTVTEDNIIKATRLIWERMKIIVEPSAAVPAAVALFDEEFKSLHGLNNVGIVFSGGNVDMEKLPWLRS